MIECKNCGVSFNPDISDGKCNVCGTVYQKKGEDWIAVDIQEPIEKKEEDKEIPGPKPKEPEHKEPEKKDSDKEEESKVKLLDFEEFYGYRDEEKGD